MTPLCCPHCDFKTVYKTNIARHVRTQHSDCAKLHECPHCDYSSHYRTHMNRHIRVAHTDSSVNFACPHCDYTSKFDFTLRRHIRMVHLGQRKECPVCNKLVANVSSHMYQKHKGLMFPCEHCAYVASSSTCLRKHMASIHDIGDHTCDVCLRTKTSVVAHEGNEVCRSCYRKMTGANTRVEKRCVEFLTQHLDGLLSTDTSMVSLGGCSRYRPDMLWLSDGLVTLVEVDEHQHNLRGGNYTCEERRLSDICVELLQSFPQHRIAVIRWNPHACAGHRATVNDRLDALLELMVALRARPPERLTVFYMWYDATNPQLVENLPRQLLYGPPAPSNFVR